MYATVPPLQNRFQPIVSPQVVPIPKSLWTRRTEHGGGVPGDGVWAVFATHEEVR